MHKFRENMEIVDIMESMWWKYADREIYYPVKIKKSKFNVDNDSAKLAAEMDGAPPKAELEKIYNITQDLKEVANHYKTNDMKVKRWIEIYDI